jgi:hypothetical protein
MPASGFWRRHRGRRRGDDSQRFRRPPAGIRRFGLTDATIVQAAAAPVLVLTIDLDLANHLAARFLPVLNFNHIRYVNWR